MRIYRPTDAKEFPPEPEKEFKKFDEGRGVRLFDNKNKGGGTFVLRLLMNYGELV